MATDFELANKPTNKPESQDSRPRGNDNNKWWLKEERDLASTVFSLTQQIVINQSRFWRDAVRYAQLYENQEQLLANPLSYQYLGLLATSQVFNPMTTYNIVKSCVDSVNARIAKNKPMVKFETVGGDYRIQKRGKNLTKYMGGCFYQSNVYTYGAQAQKDSCLFGIGCLKVYVDSETSEIKVDRVIVPSELVIDATEARYKKPRQMHQRKTISKDMLLAMYPEKASEIQNAETLVGVQSFADEQVVVIESWHLPSTKQGKDGKHAISINNAVLLEEPYTKDYFPFVFLRYTDRTEGFFGIGLCEELFTAQLHINKLHKIINASQQMAAGPRIFVEAGSLANKHTLYDAGIQELKPGAAQPIFNTTPSVAGDIYSHLENWFQKAYQISGVSQLTASSMKPAGLDSGAALREYLDANTERFAIQGERYEQMYVELAKIMLDLSRDLAKDKHDVFVKAKSTNGKFLEQIKFSEADLEDQYFELQCFPVSSLPSEPAGKLNFLKDLAQAGLIKTPMMLELMSMPDMDQYLNLTNASIEATLDDLQAMVDDEEPREPDPHMDLATAKELAQATYLYNKIRKVSDETLELLNDYINKIVALMQSANPPQEQQGQEQPEAQAQPMPPPQSDLMSQVPQG
jgi:hypothetical protein